MKAFVVLAIIGAVAAAPASNKDKLLRAKKSAYGTPCAGGPLSPVALYLSPQSPSYAGGIPHYRTDEHKEEHKEQARSYYESSGVAASAGAALASAAGGSAIGLFPNAKVGGCAVPLLLSCSPSVVSGHIAHSASYATPSAYAAVAAPSAYREPEEHHKEMKSEHASEKSWAVAERAGADLHDIHNEHMELEQKTLNGNLLDHHQGHQNI